MGKGEGSTKFKVKSNTIWSKVFDAWGQKHGEDATMYKFLLNGVVVARLASVSATQPEVQDGDVLEAFVLMQGGC